MKSKTNVLVVALVVAVLGASASALTVTNLVSTLDHDNPGELDSRFSIADVIDTLGGDSTTDFVLEFSGGDIDWDFGRFDHDGPYSLLIDDGAQVRWKISRSEGGYKLPDNATEVGLDDAFIGIYDGKLDVIGLEIHPDRGGTIEIGAGGSLRVRDESYADWETGSYSAADLRYNPLVAIKNGQIFASEGLTLDVYRNGTDHVTITAIPEPATLVLLGLGALVSMRRKRA